MGVGPKLGKSGAARERTARLAVGGDARMRDFERAVVIVDDEGVADATGGAQGGRDEPGNGPEGVVDNGEQLEWWQVGRGAW